MQQTSRSERQRVDGQPTRHQKMQRRRHELWCGTVDDNGVSVPGVVDVAVESWLDMSMRCPQEDVKCCSRDCNNGMGEAYCGHDIFRCRTCDPDRYYCRTCIYRLHDDRYCQMRFHRYGLM
jgi:hypothetical protein